VLRSAGVNAPRLVLHALLAGLYGAVLIALLLAATNPGLAWGGGDGSGRGLLVVVLAFTVVSGLVWSLLYGAIRFFASHRLQVPSLSLRYLLAFHAVNTAAVLVSAWSTLSRARKVLSPAAIENLAFFCLSLSLAWLPSAMVSIVPALRRRVLQGIALGLAMLGLALAATGKPPGQIARSGARPASLPSPSGRILLLNFDGADLDTILTLQAQGKLPAFGRLREEASYGRLQTLIPCEAPVLRSTLVTGRTPFRHGVRGGVSRHVLGRGADIQVVPVGLGFDAILAPLIVARATSISDRHGQALWEIARQAGGAGEAFGFEVDLDVAPQHRSRRVDLSAAVKERFVDGEILRKADRSLRAPLRDLAEALEADGALEPALERAVKEARPGIAAISFPGLDRVAHVFMRYAHPGEFGNVTDREVELYGEVLERYYRRIDTLVDRALQQAGGAWLMVTSSHGMDPVPLRDRIVRMMIGSESWSGTHETGPDGFLFVRGPGAGRGPMAGKGALVDVVPTALYALNLPVARDLDGAILTSVLTQRLVLERPVTVIGSYEPATAASP
jgi:Type I phosphodiesterase / nucleotide pyrophosphatase